MKKFNIPTWDEYFLSIAFVVATRSKDEQTKHGCVIVDSDNHIIGTGYNSFPKSLHDNNLPTTRPDKYDWMIHAECNAIFNCIIKPKTGLKAYITGQPCNQCLQFLWQNNIADLIIADRQGTMLENDKTDDIFNSFIKQTGMKIKILKSPLIG